MAVISTPRVATRRSIITDETFDDSSSATVESEPFQLPSRYSCNIRRLEQKVCSLLDM